MRGSRGGSCDQEGPVRTWFEIDLACPKCSSGYGKGVAHRLGQERGVLACFLRFCA